MKKKIRIIIIVLVLGIGTGIVYKIIENNVTDRETFDSKIESANHNPVETQTHDMKWDEITTNGVNEELLVKNVDEELLIKIATELQTLVKEEEEAERNNPEIVITEGWTRVFKSERYKKVINMGTSAMKPLYLILYKSPNAGIYEYICANALFELSKFDFEWENSKDFLEKFNEKIIIENNR